MYILCQVDFLSGLLPCALEGKKQLHVAKSKGRMRSRLGGLLQALLTAFSFVQLSACAQVSSATVDLIGGPVPSSRLMLLDGSQVPLQPDPGKTAVVLFWATWCPRSRVIVEDFEDLARSYAHRPDVDFFGVSVDKNEDIEVLKSRIQSQELRTMKHCFSGNDIEDEAFFSVHGRIVPFIILIDREGVVRVVSSSVDDAEGFLEQEQRGSQGLSWSR